MGLWCSVQPPLATVAIARCMGIQGYYGKRTCTSDVKLCSMGSAPNKEKCITPVCDNLSLMTAINKGSVKAPIFMHLLRCLWFFCAYFNITLTASHIPGAANTLADQLSRNHMVDFSSHATMLPCCLPRYHLLSSKLSHLKAQIGSLRPSANYSQQAYHRYSHQGLPHSTN